MDPEAEIAKRLVKALSGTKETRVSFTNIGFRFSFFFFVTSYVGCRV